MKRQAWSNLFTAAVTVCALVVVALVVRRALGSSGEEAGRPRNVARWEVYAAQGERMGPKDAPVTITSFSDFQCPACRILAERLSALRARYPGEVAVVYRHFPLPMHKSAVQAARAAECAGEQGRFEPFHDALFSAQGSIGRRPWARFAEAAGVPDTAAFAACLARPGRVPALDRDRAAGREVGVTGTPTVLINHILVQGAPTERALDLLVQRMLGAAGRDAGSGRTTPVSAPRAGR